MNIAPELKGQRLLLRKPQEKDIADRIRCGRTIDYIRMCGGDTKNILPFTEEDGQGWYQYITSNPYEWVIEFESHCIGTARLTVNEKDRRGRYAIGIFDLSMLGMGFGTESTNLVLQFAFSILKLHRVDLKVLEYNKRAIACYKKCGFIQEGIEREGAWIDEKWETDVLMSILEGEYRGNAVLVEPSIQYKKSYIEMVDEWTNTGERLIPWVLRVDYTDFDKLVVFFINQSNGIELREGMVPSSTFWLVQGDTVIGAINIRHHLTPQLQNIGGHIGYGIRPSQRQMGYGTEMLKQALRKAVDIGIDRALITCDKDNLGSAGVIENNGGVLDSEDVVNGVPILRYWVMME